MIFIICYAIGLNNFALGMEWYISRMIYLGIACDYFLMH